MIRDLVSEFDPVLRQTAPEFEFARPPINPVELAVDLTETMLRWNGLGLSACQIGLPYRAFVMKTSPVLCCFNPKIVDFSEDNNLVLEEGCLSLPGLVIKVKRPRMIRVRFQLPNGETETRDFDGITSRVFQHELDHLDGVLMFDRANRFHRDQAFRKRGAWLKRQKKNEEKSSSRAA